MIFRMIRAALTPRPDPWEQFQAKAREGIAADRKAHRPAVTAKWQREVLHKALRG